MYAKTLLSGISLIGFSLEFSCSEEKSLRFGVRSVCKSMEEIALSCSGSLLIFQQDFKLPLTNLSVLDLVTILTGSLGNSLSLFELQV